METTSTYNVPIVYNYNDMNETELLQQLVALRDECEAIKNELQQIINELKNEQSKNHENRSASQRIR